MDYRIVTKPAFTIKGYAIRTSIHDGQNLQDIPVFWSRYMQGEVGPRLCDAAVNNAEYGICDEFDAATGTFSYIIGVEPKEDAQLPEGAAVITKHYPEQTYAVFTTPQATAEQFSPSIQQTWHYIYNEWLPASDYEHGRAIEFEIYDERCWQDRNELLEMDIYCQLSLKTCSWTCYGKAAQCPDCAQLYKNFNKCQKRYYAEKANYNNLTKPGSLIEGKRYLNTCFVHT